MNHVLPALLTDENQPPQQDKRETPVKKSVCNQSTNCIEKPNVCRALMPMATVSNIQTCKPPSKRQRKSYRNNPYIYVVCVASMLLKSHSPKLNSCSL
ncbi:hypothetical protein DPMN_081019 [Dreissena polymorpha]|uniref:Uncharacterized protein n=1 Tax=Dreissena polymorpha TaxID=45954 RepID=A0A9D3Y842_DREPO|nr:hypothetical protein DPMN_081019 [Dreissena polymorpha]